MEIRFAQPGDVPGILQLLRQVGRVHYEGRPDLFRPNAQKYSASQVFDMLSRSHAPIFVAAEGNTVLGYGFCRMEIHENDSVLADQKSLYIDDICIDEKSRGKHIGTKIYETICAYAKNRGCDSITLNVWCCNPGAMKFYESLGLQPRKIVMEKML